MSGAKLELIDVAPSPRHSPVRRHTLGQPPKMSGKQFGDGQCHLLSNLNLNYTSSCIDTSHSADRQKYFALSWPKICSLCPYITNYFQETLDLSLTFLPRSIIRDFLSRVSEAMKSLTSLENSQLWGVNNKARTKGEEATKNRVPLIVNKTFKTIICFSVKHIFAFNQRFPWGNIQYFSCINNETCFTFPFC